MSPLLLIVLTIGLSRPLTPLTPPGALDQLQTPYCVGYAWWGALTTLGDINTPSPGDIYGWSKQIDDLTPGKTGTTLQAAYLSLRQRGYVKSGIVSTYDPDIIMNELKSGHVAIFAIQWPLGFIYPSNGFVHNGFLSLEYHAFFCFTFDSAGYLHCQNSWGHHYGIDGRFYVLLSNILPEMIEPAYFPIEEKPYVPRTTSGY